MSKRNLFLECIEGFNIQKLIHVGLPWWSNG